MHEHQMDKDPNLSLIMMPLLDMLNHSNQPNVAIMPYHDKLANKSFLSLTALREIGPDEQLCVSYGQLSNVHKVQKYGFTTFDDESQDQLNVIQGSYSYGADYAQIIHDEQTLKLELAEEKGITFNS